MSFEILLKDFFKNTSHANSKPDFFMSSIRTARKAQKPIRKKIISDIAEVLSCDVAALMFLFEDMSFNDNEQLVRMPVFRQELICEAAE
ncbi:MAG: hypothetical protein ABJG88_01550 [Litorimonas sp.]